MIIIDFLLARIAEDEQVAQAATPPPWRDMPMGSEGSIVTAGGNTILTARKPATCREFADATHIARQDPARALDECEAKWRIVACAQEQPNVMAEVVAHLAEVYDGHPDYDEAWRP